MKKQIIFLLIGIWLLVGSCSTTESTRTVSFRLEPAPTSCCGPEITGAVLALQKTEGYIEFSLAPPRVDEQDIRYFESMNVTFDPTQISSERIEQIVAQASGLTITEVVSEEEGR